MLLSAEDEAREGSQDEKDGHKNGAVEKEFLKPAAGEAACRRTIASESGPEAGFRTLEEYSGDEENAEKYLNIRKNLDHCLPRARSRGLYRTMLA